MQFFTFHVNNVADFREKSIGFLSNKMEKKRGHPADVFIEARNVGGGCSSLYLVAVLMCENLFALPFI